MNIPWDLWVINLGTLSTFIGTTATLWVLLQTTKLTVKFNQKASFYFHKDKLNRLLNDYFTMISESQFNNENSHKIMLHRKILSLHNYISFIDTKDKKLSALINQYIINTKCILSIKNHDEITYFLHLRYLDEVTILLDYINNTLSISARKI